MSMAATTSPGAAGCRRGRVLALVLATFMIGPAFAQDRPAEPRADAASAEAATDTGDVARAVAETAQLTVQPARADIEQAARESAERDARIAAAVSVALARAPAIPDVGVDVNSSVVTLSGTVVEERQRERAERLAKGVQGVNEVDNQLEISTDLDTRWDAAMEELQAKTTRMIAGAPLLLLAVLIVMLASWLGGFVSRHLRWFRRSSGNPYMEGLVRRVVRLLILLAGVLLALDLLGATALVGAVLGSAGVIGLALGFAFRDIAENYIAGVMLSLRRPFAPGDHVLIDGNEGRVVSLSARATILMTLDGNHLRLPNSLVFKSIILNYTHNPKRRFSFTIQIDGDESISKAQQLGLAAICGIDGVLTDPAPSSLVQSYGPNGAELQFFGWIDQIGGNFGKLRSAAIHAVKAAFDEAGIEASRSVHWIRNADAEADKAKPQELPPSISASEAGSDIDDQLAEAQREQADNNLIVNRDRDE